MALLRGGSLVPPPTTSAISRPARRSVAGTDKRRSLRLAVGRGRGGDRCALERLRARTRRVRRASSSARPHWRPCSLVRVPCSGGPVSLFGGVGKSRANPLRGRPFLAWRAARTRSEIAGFPCIFPSNRENVRKGTETGSLETASTTSVSPCFFAFFIPGACPETPGNRGLCRRCQNMLASETRRVTKRRPNGGACLTRPFRQSEFSRPGPGPRRARMESASRRNSRPSPGRAAEADLPSYGGPAGQSMRLRMEQLSDTCSAEKQSAAGDAAHGQRRPARCRARTGCDACGADRRGQRGRGRRAQQQEPRRARCSRQSSGRPRRHSRSSRAAVRSSGCSPSRMAARMSGARKASRTRRVA